MGGLFSSTSSVELEPRNSMNSPNLEKGLSREDNMPEENRRKVNMMEEEAPVKVVVNKNPKQNVKVSVKNINASNKLNNKKPKNNKINVVVPPNPNKNTVVPVVSEEEVTKEIIKETEKEVQTGGKRRKNKSRKNVRKNRKTRRNKKN